MENKVTLEGIKSKIKAECFMVLPDGRTTLCILSLENGFTVKGMSACVDSTNFDLDIGRKWAYEDAVQQIWPLEGYLLAEKLHTTQEEPKKAIRVPKGFMLSAPQVQAIKEAGLWEDEAKREKVIRGYIKQHRAKVRRDKEAPYGYKKDGTPKSKPGRKTAK